MIRRLRAIAALAGVLLTTSVHADDRLLRMLPQVQRAYQDRLDDLDSGKLRQPFRGSASIVQQRAFPWAASLGLAGVPPLSGHFCGATVIAPHWALTAAHCVADISRTGGSTPSPLDPVKIQLLTGTLQLNRDGHIHKVARIVLHPDFRIGPYGVPDNDLALLQTSDAMAEPPFEIGGPELAGLNLRPGEKIGIIGWGTATFDESSSLSFNLLFAFVDVVDRKTCQESYGNAVTDKMFCAGIGSADACQGDSGGAALGFGESGLGALVGIVSWGAGCTHKEYPGVYVNVGAYREWINATIAAAK